MTRRQLKNLMLGSGLVFGIQTTYGLTYVFLAPSLYTGYLFILLGFVASLWWCRREERERWLVVRTHLAAYDRLRQQVASYVARQEARRWN